jgi:hypothetical protein
MLQISPAAHVPHEPPHPSAPHRRAAQSGVHASTSTATSLGASMLASTGASIGASRLASGACTSFGVIPPSTIGIGRTSGETHVPSSPHVRICSSQNWLTVQFVADTLAQRAGGITRPAHDAGMKSRTKLGTWSVNRNRAVRCAVDVGCPVTAAANCSCTCSVTTSSCGPVPGTIANDAGNRKSFAAPVRVHEWTSGCADCAAPRDVSARIDNTRVGESVSTTTSTSVAGIVQLARSAPTHSANEAIAVRAGARRKTRCLTSRRYTTRARLVWRLEPPRSTQRSCGA